MLSLHSQLKDQVHLYLQLSAGRQTCVCAGRGRGGGEETVELSRGQQECTRTANAHTSTAEDASLFRGRLLEEGARTKDEDRKAQERIIMKVRRSGGGRERERGRTVWVHQRVGDSVLLTGVPTFPIDVACAVSRMDPS